MPVDYYDVVFLHEGAKALLHGRKANGEHFEKELSSDQIRVLEDMYRRHATEVEETLKAMAS